ncbi:hypothetical protein Tco_1158518, partial [Tanacetum coccineum]
EEPVKGLGEITIPPVSSANNSSDPVIIKARISGRQVNRVYMDNESSCEVIYEHCFLKLMPSIKSLRVDLKIPLCGFSGEQSWSLGELPLEITIGDSLFIRIDILNFVIMRSNSPHNLLLGWTTMQRMGIIVSTIYEASQEATKGILSCADTEERIVINKKYPKQTIFIGKQLPTSFKKRLWDLLKANVDVFAWTYADMMGIPRTIMVRGKPFNTEHKLNEFKHIEPVKQKKRSLAPERIKAIHKEVEELMKASILREVKYQMWVSNLVMVKKDDGRWKLSRQDPSLLENTKEFHEWENSSMDNRAKGGIPIDEGAHGDVTNGYISNQRQSLGNVPRNLRRKRTCSVASRKRKEANSYLLCKPDAARGRIS